MFAQRTKCGNAVSTRTCGMHTRSLCAKSGCSILNNLLPTTLVSQNIFFEADGTLRLGDFGLAINATRERPISRVGTLDYMAPEVLCVLCGCVSGCRCWPHLSTCAEHTPAKRHRNAGCLRIIFPHALPNPVTPLPNFATRMLTPHTHPNDPPPLLRFWPSRLPTSSRCGASTPTSCPATTPRLMCGRWVCWCTRPSWA